MYFTKKKIKSPVPKTEYQFHTKYLSIVCNNSIGWSKRNMFHCQLLGFVKANQGLGIFIIGQYIGFHWGQKQSL